MGIALRIRGRYGSRLAPFAPRADAFLRELQSWWQRNHGALLLGAWRKSGAADFSPPKDDDVGLKPDAPPDDGQESPSLAIAIHPGAENVVFTVPRRGHIEVQAKTSTVGPGYHMFVCDALHALAPELGVRWDPLHEESLDEGFYFHTRNPSDIHEEMRNFIRNLAAHAMNGYAGHVLQLSMPSQFRYDVPDADVLTPLGPRDRDWLAGAAADGARGIDVFPWWHRGAGAHYWLGRALVRMWSAVRWRAPFNDEQRETLQEVHAALTAAYRAEPRLTYPWREWSEVATLLGVRA
ncbi:MAG TPA: hypothetical protein VND45_04880, partial [Thermoanaerobaculia bacterium]|nr:hypothetical protein [Thermoanaerobaculia bacterium]